MQLLLAIRGEQGASTATIKLSVLMPTMSGLSIYLATVSDDCAGKTRRRQVYVTLEVLIGRSQCGPGCCSAYAADAPQTPAGRCAIGRNPTETFQPRLIPTVTRLSWNFSTAR